MWKYQDFSVIQILREINVRESRSSKTLVFASLEALNFVKYLIWPSKIAKTNYNKNSEPLNLIKLISRKILVTENL